MEEFNVVTRIKNLMAQKNVKISDLATRCDWPMSKVSKILSGSQKISTDDLIVIALALNTNPALLISPDMSDVVDDRQSVTEIGHIFNKVCMAFEEDDKDTIIKYVEDELPRAVAHYLCLKDTGKSVDVVLRPKRIVNLETEFTSYPRVVVNDKSEGQLFKNQLTVGYWFDEDWKGVYLAINFTKKMAARTGAATASIRDMKEWFLALSKGKILYNENMQRSERSIKSHNMYEAGMLYCKYYELNRFYDEERIKLDLQEAYDLYLELLELATERVQSTYENLYQSQRERERRESETSKEGGSFDISDLDRIMPVEIKSYGSPNQRIRSVRAALEKKDYRCECNPEHETFLAKKNGKPYMQGHMLVPMSAQPGFRNSLQVQANYCCLCPNCHAKLEYGTDSDRQEMIMQLYLAHKDDLIEAGIEVTPMQLFKFYGMN